MSAAGETLGPDSVEEVARVSGWRLESRKRQHKLPRQSLARSRMAGNPCYPMNVLGICLPHACPREHGSRQRVGPVSPEPAVVVVHAVKPPTHTAMTGKEGAAGWSTRQDKYSSEAENRTGRRTDLVGWHHGASLLRNGRKSPAPWVVGDVALSGRPAPPQSVGPSIVCLRETKM